MGVARSKRRPRGLPGRVVRYMSSQLTKLNGDFGREKCRDPKYNHLLANIVIFAEDRSE